MFGVGFPSRSQKRQFTGGLVVVEVVAAAAAAAAAVVVAVVVVGVCVCVCGVAEYPATKSFSVAAGGPSVCCVRWSNEAATANADIEADHLDVPATFGVGDVKSFWPVVSLAVCASC